MTAQMTASMAGLIDSASIIVCCGSGGVGKTTTAAVIGHQAAKRGRRVVVVTIDPAKRLADALGLEGGLEDRPQRVDLRRGDDGNAEGSGELWAMMLDTATMFATVVAENASDADQAARIAENRFARTIATSLSGTQDYMATEALYRLHGDERFDLVVVDTAPSREALDFLAAPGVLARFLDHRVFRLMMLPTRRGMSLLNTAAQPALRAIGRVVGSDVLADAVAFFQAFSGMEAGFRERAVQVEGLLRDPQTAFVLVASPRHDTITEAVWFADRLASHSIEVAAVIVNRLHPDPDPIDAETAAEAALDAERAGNVDLARLWRNVETLARLAAAEQREIEPLFGRAPIMVRIPLLGSDVHDAAGLAQFGDHLLST